MNEMKDWPKTLKVNAAAAHLAKAIYHARSEVYGWTYVHWENCSPDVHQKYMELATRLLMDIAPEPHQVAKRACVKCGTRDQHKNYAPYCSHICEERATRRDAW